MRITDFIDLIDGTNAHVYVVKVDNRVIQVDSGSRGDLDKIVSYYSSTGLRPDAVFITHPHADHIGALAGVVERYRPRVYAHPLEIPVVEGRQPLKGALLTRVATAFMRPRPVSGVLDALQMPRDLGLSGVSVIETPGHTPGSVTLLVEREGKRYAFVGDAIIVRGGSPTVSRLLAWDYNRALLSFARIRDLGPVTVLPGHGQVIELAR